MSYIKPPKQEGQINTHHVLIGIQPNNIQLDAHVNIVLNLLKSRINQTYYADIVSS